MNRLPEDALTALQEVMRKGGETHDPPDSWKDQSVGEHIRHLALHLVEYAKGDTSEPHLLHAACRGILAVAVELRSGEEEQTARPAVPLC